MRAPRNTALAAAGIVAGLLATGCGDDPEPLTKAEFVERANAICAETQAIVEPIFEAVWEDVGDTDPNSPEGQTSVFVRFDEAVDEVLPHFKQQLEDIRELAPPRADEELIETLLDDTEAAVDEFARLMDAAAAGDEAAMAALESDDPIVEVDRRAREYGLDVCGDGE